MKHLTPTAAWALLQQRRDEPPETAPLFVDVRMEIESLYVGRPPRERTSLPSRHS